MYSQSFSLTTEETVPKAFTREDGESIYAFLDLPGIPKNKVDVIVTSDRDLVIKGNVIEAYMCESRNYNSKIKITDNIKICGIEANMKDGVLKVTLPKLIGTKDEAMTNELKITVT